MFQVAAQHDLAPARAQLDQVRQEHARGSGTSPAGARRSSTRRAGRPTPRRTCRSRPRRSGPRRRTRRRRSRRARSSASSSRTRRHRCSPSSRRSGSARFSGPMARIVSSRSASCALTSCTQTTSAFCAACHSSQPLRAAERMPFRFRVMIRIIACFLRRRAACPGDPVLSQVDRFEFIRFALERRRAALRRIQDEGRAHVARTSSTPACSTTARCWGGWRSSTRPRCSRPSAPAPCTSTCCSAPPTRASRWPARPRSRSRATAATSASRTTARKRRTTARAACWSARRCAGASSSSTT